MWAHALPLAVRVTRDELNCVSGNAQNLLKLLGLHSVSYERVTYNISCLNLNKENFWNQLYLNIKGGGYTVSKKFKLDFDQLSLVLNKFKQPMFLCLPVGDSNAMMHIVGIYQVTQKDSEPTVHIVDGAHHSLKTIRFNKANLMWCCGSEFKSICCGFSFSPGTKLRRTIRAELGSSDQIERLDSDEINNYVKSISKKSQ